MVFLGSIMSSCSSEAQNSDTGLTQNQPVEKQAVGQASTGPEDVDVNRFEELLQQEGMQVLDVRTPEEIAQGYVEGAVFINWHDAEFENKAKNVLNTDLPLTVYCKSGGRSSQAVNVLHAAGFGKIYNYTGGMSEWYQLEKPTLKD